MGIQGDCTTVVAVCMAFVCEYVAIVHLSVASDAPEHLAVATVQPAKHQITWESLQYSQRSTRAPGRRANIASEAPEHLGVATV